MHIFKRTGPDSILSKAYENFFTVFPFFLMGKTKYIVKLFIFSHTSNIKSIINQKKLYEIYVIPPYNNLYPINMSTFGTVFKVTTFGESHCKSVGCIVDGVPPNLEITEEKLQVQLTRRRPGQSKLTTPRNEKDKVEIQSGTEFNKSLGTPIALIVKNEDQRPHDYKGDGMNDFQDLPMLISPTCPNTTSRPPLVVVDHPQEKPLVELLLPVLLKSS